MPEEKAGRDKDEITGWYHYCPGDYCRTGLRLFIPEQQYITGDVRDRTPGSAGYPGWTTRPLGFLTRMLLFSELQVYNTGNTTAKNVRLVVELVHINDNAVRDTREVFIGTLGPGASTDAAVELDGECLKDYNLRAFTAYD